MGEAERDMCEIILQYQSMKDQHKNKLLEILGEAPTHSLQFANNSQNRKNRGRGGWRGEKMEGGEARGGEARVVEVLAGELQHHLSVYAWRMRTNQPLLAANCLELQLRRGEPFIPPSALPIQLSRCPLPPEALVRLRVETEPSSLLSDLMPLSLSQHLYCLKQAAYGLEQLHSCFGGFEVDGRALRVAAGGKIKVWHSLPLLSNPKVEGDKRDEQRVVEGVLRVFQEWRGETRGFRQFYEEVTPVTTFLQLIRTIDAFIQLHKIKIDKRLTQRDPQQLIRPHSPHPDIGRVPKFLSPTAIALKPAAGIRLSLGFLPNARRLPHAPPYLEPYSPSPSPSPQKESINLKATAQTRSPRRVNLVRTDKQRKGSDNNFCFTSLHRLEATRDNLMQAKTSEIFHSPQTMTSLDPGNSLLRNVQQLFEQDELQGLSVSVQMKDRGGKGLALYGRRVNESFINCHPHQ